MKEYTRKYYIAPTTIALYVGAQLPLTLSVGNGTTPSTGDPIPADDGGGNAKRFGGWDVGWANEGQGLWD